MKNKLLAGLVGLAIFTGTTRTGATEFPSSSSRSTSAVPEVLTLEQATEEALDHGPTLRVLDHGTMAAQFEAQGAARTRWGELDALGSYLYFNDDRLVRPISRQLLGDGLLSLPFDRNQTHFGLVYRIPLYLGGKLQAEIQVAKLEAHEAQELLTGTAWQIRFNVTSLYATEQALREVKLAFDEQIVSLEDTEQRLELMVREGRRPDIDRLKVVEELESARAERASVEADRVKALALLLSTLGRDPSLPVKLEPLPDDVPALKVTPQEIRRIAQLTSPIRRADLGAQTARSGVKVARSEYLPSLFAWGNAMRNDGPSLDSSFNTWELAVGLKLPLFAGGARSSRLSAAREKRRAAEVQSDRARLDHAAKVEEALARFDAALSEVNAARARVAAGTEAARIEQVRYETGAGTVEDLLRAQSRQQQALAARARAMAHALVAARLLDTLAESEVVE